MRSRSRSCHPAIRVQTGAHAIFGPRRHTDPGVAQRRTLLRPGPDRDLRGDGRDPSCPQRQIAVSGVACPAAPLGIAQLVDTALSSSCSLPSGIIGSQVGDSGLVVRAGGAAASLLNSKQQPLSALSGGRRLGPVATQTLVRRRRKARKRWASPLLLRDCRRHEPKHLLLGTCRGR